jgi:hypothetical protein
MYVFFCQLCVVCMVSHLVGRALNKKGNEVTAFPHLAGRALNKKENKVAAHLRSIEVKRRAARLSDPTSLSYLHNISDSASLFQLQRSVLSTQLLIFPRLTQLPFLCKQQSPSN